MSATTALLTKTHPANNNTVVMAPLKTQLQYTVPAVQYILHYTHCRVGAYITLYSTHSVVHTVHHTVLDNVWYTLNCKVHTTIHIIQNLCVQHISYTDQYALYSVHSTVHRTHTVQ